MHVTFFSLHVNIHKLLNTKSSSVGFPVCFFTQINLRNDGHDGGYKLGRGEEDRMWSGRNERKCCVLVKCDIVTFKWLDFLSVSVSVCVGMRVQLVNCPIAWQPTWLRLHTTHPKHFPLISLWGNWKHKLKSGSGSVITVCHCTTQLNHTVWY